MSTDTAPEPARRDRANPVMEDVARHAGVSLGTVSNVLNNPGIVTAKTRERVNAAIAELGFIPNRIARSLAVGHANTIGFVTVDLANSYFVDIARGVEEVMDQSGVRILLANSDVDLAKQSTYIELFEESRVSGILLAPLDAPMTRAEAARQRGTPVVYVNWPGVDGESCGVVVNEELGGYTATRHLIDIGCRRLLFAGGPLTLSAVAERLSGARRAVAEQAGVVELELLETDKLTVKRGLDVGRGIAARAPGDRPDGLVSAADALASGAVQAMMYEGMEMPGDIAVIGYDNNHFAADHVVPISTVGQPGVDMGRAAARLLLEEISGASHQHRTITMDPELIVRASTAGR
ncbi:LacI family DNA-binding transcriptional regulator [Phytoactinopolyspora mesophila]|uniref:LacI family DNA-binding transcriptional regulator n=1 Tax=Phytoactinopolyspora mesophila TaxID=2650750 RepID=A0A7K3M6H9_9ACTN|nr:LacI family DNA-binding transcriptional regulator [Phytoactinopolyspora mesophila]NDL58855.1 LacI family DNA-binding transcriptional regulator [Phytoactinopolyspora mesophila]